MKVVNFVVLLATLAVHRSSAVTHTLKYFHTAFSGVLNLPEFVGVALVDDVQILHYDSNSSRTQAKQEWMMEATADDPRYWKREDTLFLANHHNFKSRIEMLKPSFNQTGGVHVYQRMSGCQWDDETQKTDGFSQDVYDGEDLLVFKLKEAICVAAKQEAKIVDRDADQKNARMESLKYYLTHDCIYWLKKFVDYGRSSLMRTELPSVSLLQKTPSSPVSCHATGFYPETATLSWRKDEEELHEEVDQGEVLPNPDGTFQMRADLRLSSVPPEDWSSYKCVFQLSGGEEVLTSLDRNQIRTNWGKTGVDENPTDTVVIAAVTVVVLALVLVAILGFIVFRWKEGKRSEGHPQVTQPLTSTPT